MTSTLLSSPLSSLSSSIRPKVSIYGSWKTFATYRVPRYEPSEIVSRRRAKRFVVIGISLATIGLCLFGLIDKFEDNLMFYVTPTQVVERWKENKPHKDRMFRLGGLVKEGSLVRGSRMVQGLSQPEFRFIITDHVNEIPVVFCGVPPNMFKENQGAVCQGRFREDGLFEAREVLAKHNEEYVPISIAKELKGFTNIQGMTREELREKMRQKKSEQLETAKSSH